MYSEHINAHINTTITYKSRLRDTCMCKSVHTENALSPSLPPPPPLRIQYLTTSVAQGECVAAWHSSSRGTTSIVIDSVARIYAS